MNDVDLDLAEALGHAILGPRAGVADRDGRPTDTLDPDDHLALVRRAARAEQLTKDLLARTVAAARGAGHSWATIGDELGLTRQAVHQRFGASDDTIESEHRWLGPVTAFDELPELQLAGRQGWRTVGAGMLRHRMRRTQTQWEHRRVLWTRPARFYETDGWEVGCRAFPWLYLVRDLGLPPEPERSDV